MTEGPSMTIFDTWASIPLLADEREWLRQLAEACQYAQEHRYQRCSHTRIMEPEPASASEHPPMCSLVGAYLLMIQVPQQELSALEQSPGPLLEEFYLAEVARMILHHAGLVVRPWLIRKWMDLHDEGKDFAELRDIIQSSLDTIQLAYHESCQHERSRRVKPLPVICLDRMIHKKKNGYSCEDLSCPCHHEKLDIHPVSTSFKHWSEGSRAHMTGLSGEQAIHRNEMEEKSR